MRAFAPMTAIALLMLSGTIVRAQEGLVNCETFSPPRMAASMGLNPAQAQSPGTSLWWMTVSATGRSAGTAPVREWISSGHRGPSTAR